MRPAAGVFVVRAKDSRSVLGRGGDQRSLRLTTRGASSSPRVSAHVAVKISGRLGVLVLEDAPFRSGHARFGKDADLGCRGPTSGPLPHGFCASGLVGIGSAPQGGSFHIGAGAPEESRFPRQAHARPSGCTSGPILRVRREGA